MAVHYYLLHSSEYFIGDSFPDTIWWWYIPLGFRYRGDILYLVHQSTVE